MIEILTILAILVLITLLAFTGPMGQNLLQEVVSIAIAGDARLILMLFSGCIVLVLSIYSALKGRKLAKEFGFSKRFWTVACFFLTIWGLMAVFYLGKKRTSRKVT